MALTQTERRLMAALTALTKQHETQSIEHAKHVDKWLAAIDGWRTAQDEQHALITDLLQQVEALRRQLDALSTG